MSIFPGETDGGTGLLHLRKLPGLPWPAHSQLAQLSWFWVMMRKVSRAFPPPPHWVLSSILKKKLSRAGDMDKWPKCFS